MDMDSDGNGNGNGTNVPNESPIEQPQSLEKPPEPPQDPIREATHYTTMAHHSGQPICKFSTIAGAKDGGCERYAVEVCLTCRQPFCPDHASVIDQNYCCGCLSPQTTELLKEPLVDTSGVTHKGVHITLRGPAYPSLNTRIYQMTRPELESFIREERVKVNQAESVRDYHRIALSSASLELEFRTQEDHRKLRGVKLPKPVTTGTNATAGAGGNTNGTGNGNGAAGPRKGTNDLAEVMKSMNIPATPENIQKLAMFLAGAKSKK